MIDPGRLARAVYLDASPRGGGVWHVLSPETFHVVHMADSGPLCDCADFTNRGISCKHVLAVRLCGGDTEVLRALRQLVANPSRVA